MSVSTVIHRIKGNENKITTLENQVNDLINNPTGGGAVDSVFGRTGVVVKNANDYNVNDIDYDGVDNLGTKLNAMDTTISNLTQTVNDNDAKIVHTEFTYTTTTTGQENIPFSLSGHKFHSVEVCIVDATSQEPLNNNSTYNQNSMSESVRWVYNLDRSQLGFARLSGASSVVYKVHATMIKL